MSRRSSHVTVRAVETTVSTGAELLSRRVRRCWSEVCASTARGDDRVRQPPPPHTSVARTTARRPSHPPGLARPDAAYRGSRSPPLSRRGECTVCQLSPSGVGPAVRRRAHASPRVRPRALLRRANARGSTGPPRSCRRAGEAALAHPTHSVAGAGDDADSGTIRRIATAVTRLPGAVWLAATLRLGRRLRRPLRDRAGSSSVRPRRASHVPGSAVVTPTVGRSVRQGP